MSVQLVRSVRLLKSLQLVGSVQLLGLAIVHSSLAFPSPLDTIHGGQVARERTVPGSFNVAGSGRPSDEHRVPLLDMSGGQARRFVVGVVLLDRGHAHDSIGVDNSPMQIGFTRVFHELRVEDVDAGHGGL